MSAGVYVAHTSDLHGTGQDEDDCDDEQDEDGDGDAHADVAETTTMTTTTTATTMATRTRAKTRTTTRRRRMKTTTTMTKTTTTTTKKTMMTTATAATTTTIVWPPPVLNMCVSPQENAALSTNADDRRQKDMCVSRCLRRMCHRLVSIGASTSWEAVGAILRSTLEGWAANERLLRLLSGCRGIL